MGGDWHCPDLPGHGAKPQLDCSPRATAQLIERELSTLHSPLPTAKYILLGYSMGARAALQHVVAYPEAWDALILISPQPGIEDPAGRAARRNIDATLADRIEREGAPAFIQFWQQTPMIRSQQSIRPDWRAAMQAARAEHTAQGLAASLRQFGQGHCPNLWPELKKLSLPTLLITGEQDSKYSKIAVRMASHRTNPQAPLIEAAIIEGAGHAPHLEAPEMAARIVREFLNHHS